MRLEEVAQQVAAKGYTPGTDAARNWIRSKVALIDITREEELEYKDPVFDPYPGAMYMFYYNPKFRATLPFYDRFPLAIIKEFTSGGFYGCNLHYLTLRERARLFDTQGNMDYNHPLLSYAVRHYLKDHIVGKIVQVPREEWDVALMVPFELFEGPRATKDNIYRRK